MEQFGLGGTDVHLANLINNWPDRKDEIFYITNEGNKGMGLFNSLLNRECKIVKINLKSYGYFSQRIHENNWPMRIKQIFSYLLLLFKYSLFMLDILRLAFLFKKFSFDIFISDNGGYPGSDSCRAAIFASHICGIKKRYAIMHHEAVKPEKIFIPFEYLIDRLIQKSVRGIITVSEASKKSLLLNRYFNGKINVIYNGIEDGLPSNKCIDLRKEYRISDNKKIIGIMGNIEPHKGHEVLIRSIPMILSAYPDVHFLFIGSLYDSGWQRKHADKIINLIKEREFQDIITITGYLDGRPLDFIDQFDILIMPTLDFEGFGLVLAEAMILNKPIIASNVGAIPEVIIGGESGILIPPGEPTALAEGIIETLKDDQKAQMLSKNARKRYEKYFTAKKMSRNYFNLISAK